MKTPLSDLYQVQLNRVITHQWTFCVVLLLFLGLPTVTCAQNKVWDKTFGGNSDDNLEFLQQTSDGGYILGGTSASGISGNKTQASKGSSDYWIVKLRANGTKAWEKVIGSTNGEYLTSLQQTSDGGYILGGSSYSGIGGDKTQTNRGQSDYWVVKLSASGSKVWDRTFGSTSYDELTSLQQTSEGGYILGGYSSSNSGGDKSGDSKGDYDYWVVKLNSSGNKVWDKTIGGESSDWFKSIQQTSEGGYILGGYSSSGISGDKSGASKGGDDYWIVKLRADGTKTWDKTVGSNGYDVLNALQQTSEGGYILGGTSYASSSGDKSSASKGGLDYWVVKLKANGAKTWDKTIGGSDYDELTSLQQTSDGGYILGGSSFSDKSGDKGEDHRGGLDYWVVKLKADGTRFWDKTLGGDGWDELQVVKQTSDGSYLLGGYSESGISGDKTQANLGETYTDDYWVVKLDNSGVNLNQVITFSPIGDKIYGAAPFTLSAKSTSGLPVTFSVVSGPATLSSGKVITLTGLGTVTVKASAAGNGTYKPATTTQTFIVRANIEQPWDKTFGGSNLDNLTTMVATPDGGYLLGGSSASGISGNKSQPNKGNTDYWLVKTDNLGNKLSDKVYGGSGADNLTVLMATPDGGYLLGGSSASGISGNKTQASRGGTDYWVIKVNENGTKIWDKTYGGGGADNLAAIITTPDGGFLLGGSSASGISGDKSQANKGSTDYWLVKIDSNGNKIWDKAYGGSNTDNLAALVTTNNGGYLLGGSSASGISGDKSQAARGEEDYWVVRLNGAGTIIWEKTFGGIKDTYTDEGCNPDEEDCTRYFGGSALSALVATPDGGFLLGGSSNADAGGEKSEGNLNYDTFGYDAFLKDYWVVKIDKNGNKIWDNTYSGINEFNDDGEGWFFVTGHSILRAIIPTTDGNYVLAGSSNSGKGGDKSESSVWEDEEASERNDYWLIKIDGNGNKRWDETIGGLSNDYLTAILPDAADGYVVGGTSASGLGGDKSEASKDASGSSWERADYWIVKIKDETPPIVSDWNMRYGGSGTEGFTAVIKTADGGYLSGGYSPSGVSGDKTQTSRGRNDFWLVKSDAAGRKLWDKRYGGSADDYLNTIIQTLDGGYLLGGSSLSGSSGDKTQPSRGNRDYWIVKISSTGTKQWDKRFGGTGYDELKKVLQLSTGEYLLAGSSNSPVGGDKSQASRGGQDYWVVKITSTGTKLWDKRYGGSLDENLEGLSFTNNGGYLLGGSSFSGISGDKTQLSWGGSDYWVVRLDGSGNKVWDKRFGGTGQDNLMDLGSTGTSTGNFFIAGHSTSGLNGDKSQTSQGGKDFWMLKINGNGTKLWDKRFGGGQDEGLRSIIMTSEGGYLLGGRSESGIDSESGGLDGDKTQLTRGGSDYWIVKTSSTGVKQWDKRFGGAGYDEIRTVLQTQDGGYLMGGRSDSGVSGDRSQPSQGGSDYWLVKILPETMTMAAPLVAAARETTVAEKAITPAEPLSVITAYPNPFAEQVTVNFTLPETQPVQVKVYDSQGREIATLFQGEAKANQAYQVEWKASNKATGLYILQLQTPTKRHQQKLLLAR